jgi:hypothetical protein
MRERRYLPWARWRLQRLRRLPYFLPHFLP